MARNRTISPDFWTWEAVIDCKPMTRLLFIGLWNFADDFGVQPFRRRTIRMQVFPGDAVDADAVRSMIDELAARGLVRLYEVDGVAYVQIVDWNQMQRVGKRTRRRYPAEPGAQTAPTIEDHGVAETPRPPPSGRAIAYGVGTPQPHAEEAAQRPSRSMDHRHRACCPPFETPAMRAPQGEVGGICDSPAPSGEADDQAPQTSTDHSNDQPAPHGEVGIEGETESQELRRKIKYLMHQYWPRHAAIEAMDDGMADRWTAKWIAEGRDYRHDIVLAVRDSYVTQPGYPPVDWRELDARLRRSVAPA